MMISVTVLAKARRLASNAYHLCQTGREIIPDVLTVLTAQAPEIARQSVPLSALDGIERKRLQDDAQNRHEEVATVSPGRE